MAEEVLYEAGVVKITPARVVIGGSTYVVANIASVQAVTDSKLRFAGYVVMFIGLALALALSATTAGVVLGVTVVLAGAILAKFGVSTEVVITTGAAQQVALRSRDASVALRVASAINLAVMKRSEHSPR